MPTARNTVAEVEEYALEHGIDLSGCKTKAQKLERCNAR